MVDKAKILAEIERLFKSYDSVSDYPRMGVCTSLLSFINSLPEEPLNEKQMYKAGYLDGFEDGVRDSMEKEEELINKSAWLTELKEKLDNASEEQLKEWYDKYLKDDNVSEDLEESAEKYVQGFHTAIQRMCKESFKEGAQWQKEQLMKGFCYETEVYLESDGDGIDTELMEWLDLENTEICQLPESLDLKAGDKVKVIIVKEN